jgi:hypothetical protein
MNKLSESAALPWALVALVTIAPLLAWLSLLYWEAERISTWTLFPLLGVLAWSLMWTHYAFGAIRVTRPDIPKQPTYSKATSIAVLTLLLLHPLLLARNMLDTTQTLPPESFFSYVGPGNEYIVVLGYIGLALFLAYEIVERLKKRQWVRRNWRWVSISQIVAMAAIFVHGLSIGQIINNSWYGIVWAGLGIILIPCAWIILRHDWKSSLSND